jgi:hypothetical protein
MLSASRVVRQAAIGPMIRNVSLLIRIFFNTPWFFRGS